MVQDGSRGIQLVTMRSVKVIKAAFVSKWKIITQPQEKIGFGWNDELKMIIVSKQVYDEEITTVLTWNDVVRQNWLSDEGTKGSWPGGDFQSPKTNTLRTLVPHPDHYCSGTHGSMDS
ncbi:unnamed protein product [Dovyalis caffra]|uniref:Uncharacterized protein n=1 Tax=Dovyalis caffra TaxID=77055 RepID=A0AAV1R531_9ROSI|nr:unnamed protein product [Dovyalis caffra]